MPTTIALVFLQFVIGSMPVFSQVPDFSGTWLSVPELADHWEVAMLPLTPEAKAHIDGFDPRRLDSTYFCMPFGTPRNVLNTAERPLRLIQTGTQLTFLFDGLGDVRRVFLDGRSHPADAIPSWMGHSIGHWDGKTLAVDTAAMTGESILSEQGLPHSDALKLQEQLHLVERKGETLLQIDLQLTDSMYYRTPLKATRYFRRVAHAQPSEGSSQCLLDQWRRRLEDINRRMYKELQTVTREQKR